MSHDILNPKSFHCEPGFCSNCGTILPLVVDIQSLKCNVCGTPYSVEEYGTMECYYEINFHTPDEYAQESQNENELSVGPIVTRKCPNCGNNKMSYATLQLRSADEGQTVFYTCVKCKYKENENS